MAKLTNKELKHLYDRWKTHFDDCGLLSIEIIKELIELREETDDHDTSSYANMINNQFVEKF